MNYRNLRVAKLIQEELSKIILRELEFQKGVLVTITEVTVSQDLNQAKITLGVIPETAAAEVKKIIGDNQRFLQNLLMKKLNIKPMPKLEFRI